MRNPPSQNNHRSNPEPLLWVALATLAALLRLVNLGLAPLSTAEAEQALAAFHAASGAGVRIVGAPLLYHLNVLLFSLFDAGDGLARLVPALSGVGLALTPLLLRRYLGRWGALGTGLLLTLSPLTWWASRTLDGTTVAALGVMVLVGSAAQYLDTWQPRAVTAGALGLTVALTAGAGAWGLLLGLLIALAIGLWIWREQLEWLWPMARPALGKGLTVAGLAALMIGSGLGLYPAGLAGIGEQAVAWAGRFALPNAASPAPLRLYLLTYEPLVLVFGLAGLALALRRRHGMGLLWGFWAAVAALQLALMPGRQPADLVWLIVPLAGLGGLAIQALVDQIVTHGHWLNEGLYLPISLVLWVHLGLAVARHSTPTSRPLDLTLAALTLLLQLFLLGVFAFAVSVPNPEQSQSEAMRQVGHTALRAGGLSLGLLLLTITLSFGWGLSHGRPGDPRELPGRPTTTVETRLLADVAEQVGLFNIGVRTGLEVAIVGNDPVVRWTLREFEQQPIEGLQLVTPETIGRPALIVSPPGTLSPTGYFGTAFPIRRVWDPSKLRCSAWPLECTEIAQWWIYRLGDDLPTVTTTAVLWVREDLGTAALR